MYEQKGAIVFSSIKRLLIFQHNRDPIFSLIRVNSIEFSKKKSTFRRSLRNTVKIACKVIDKVSYSFSSTDESLVRTKCITSLNTNAINNIKCFKEVYTKYYIINNILMGEL